MIGTCDVCKEGPRTITFSQGDRTAAFCARCFREHNTPKRALDAVASPAPDPTEMVSSSRLKELRRSHRALGILLGQIHMFRQDLLDGEIERDVDALVERLDEVVQAIPETLAVVEEIES